MDRTAQDNFLLDSVEFSDEDIHNAMTLAIDKYNSTLPMVDVYSVEDFPYRYELMLGASGILLTVKAANLSRNDLAYSTKEGTSINPNEKKGDYLKLGQVFSAEFQERITQIKKTKNAEQAYGSVSGIYREGGWW